MTSNPSGPGRPFTAEVLDSLLLDTTPWLSCDDCFVRMDAYVEALVAGAPTGDPAMAAHLRGCRACAEEAEGLAELVSGRTGEEPEPR